MGHSNFPVEWSLTSTNGYARLSCTPESEGGLSLLHDVRLDYCLPGELARATLTVPRLALSKEGLRALLVALRSWLGQPLDALRVESFVHSCDLGDGSTESLKLEFGPREDVITGVGAIGCLVEIRSSALRSSLSFRTDATCLELLAEALEHVLARSLAENHEDTQAEGHHSRKAHDWDWDKHPPRQRPRPIGLGE